MDRDLVDKLIDELRVLRTELDQPIRESSPRPEWIADLLAHSPDVIVVHDRAGKVVYINKTRPPTTVEGALGRSVTEFFAEEQRAPLEDALERAAATKEPQQFEATSMSGYVWTFRVVPIVQNERIERFITSAMDISAQRRAEHALRFKEEHLRLALDASGMGQWRWNIAKNQITGDAVTQHLLGWTGDAGAIDYANYMERVHPEDREMVRDYIARSVETGQFQSNEHRIIVGDEVRWVLATGKVLRDADGVSTDLVGGVIDVTRQRKQEQNERRQQKLEAIGQLAGGVAHDFNNLLVAIVGNIDLAKMTPDRALLNGLLDEALVASIRAADLIKQLLAFSRRSQIHETPLDMGMLLEDTIKLLKRLIPESIQIDYIGGHRLPRVLGDRSQLEQIVVNLCVNARDAMPNGGRLVIETEVVVINGRYRESHPWARPGRYVLLSISDTGFGISQADLEHVFEPFFTTKTDGTGLGLATVYGIVKQHGGLVHLYSEVGKGTTFKIYLPVAERDAAEVGPKIEEPVVGGTETILVAEDEEPVRRVMCQILENAGYTVLRAVDGVEALEVFEARKDEIDAVVLDAVMPRKNGTEVAIELRHLNPNIVIVLSSGYSDALAANPCVAKRSSAFLAKPYEPDTLLRTVRRALDAQKTPSSPPPA